MTQNPAKSRRTRYRVKDPLFKFWFRFIYGQSNRYDFYEGDAFEDLIMPELPDFISDTFERLCAKSLFSLYPEINFVNAPGQWWEREREIDVVGLSDSVLIAGEAKFTSKPIGYQVFSQLENDVKYVDWDSEEVYYALFSRSGFKKSVKEAAKEQENLHLYDLQNVINALMKNT